MFLINLASLYLVLQYVDARVSLKVATKGSKRGKKTQITFLKQKRRGPTKKIGVSVIHLELLALPSYMSSENWCSFFTQTSQPFGGKKYLKIYILRLLFQRKNGAVRPKKLSLSDKFGTLISGLDTYFLEVSAHALLKVATETSFSGKKSQNFQKQKRRNMTFVFFIILERSYLVQIHTFWRSVHEFFVHNIFVTIGSLE